VKDVHTFGLYPSHAKVPQRESLLCLSFWHAQPRLSTARQAVYDGLVKAHTRKAMDLARFLHVLAFAVETAYI
jgi:hypothetical protein